MFGLTRVSAIAGSLLLNLEAPLTMLIAVAVFKEHLGGRQAIAASLILLGAAIVGLQPGDLRAHAIGIMAIAAASGSWAIDTNLSQRLSLRDPIALTRFKGLAGGACTLLLAHLAGEPFPESKFAALTDRRRAARSPGRWMGAARNGVPNFGERAPSTGGPSGAIHRHTSGALRAEARPANFDSGNGSPARWPGGAYRRRRRAP